MPPKKRTSNPKGQYVIHSRHDRIPDELETMNYVSFDPGQKNFDVRFESRGKDITTRAQAKYVIPFARTRVNTGTISEATLYIVDILDDYEDLLASTHIALIEDQMCINNDMMHIISVLITYFVVKYPTIVTISPGSKLKGTMLGASKMSRPELKTWGEDKAIDLAQRRGDRKFLRYLDAQSIDSIGKKLCKSKIKIDDSTDNLIQIEAFCVVAGYKLTRRYPRTSRIA